jgi:phage FluMu protein Com
MTDQVHKIKCPHCGWIRRWILRVEGNHASIVAGGGVTDAIKAINARIAAMFADPELAEANAWIDIPECPNCQQVYQYNLRTGATK